MNVRDSSNDKTALSRFNYLKTSRGEVLRVFFVVTDEKHGYGIFVVKP